MSGDNEVRADSGPDFAVWSYALPRDHWLYEEKTNVPPMPMRMGVGEMRNAVAERIREAAQYAVRASTMNGKSPDWDPDAVVQNIVVGLLGYWTADGLSGETWGDPSPVPPIYEPRAVPLR